MMPDGSRRSAEMSIRSVVSYSAVVAIVLASLFIPEGRLNPKIEYPRSEKAYAGLAGPGERFHADTRQSRRLLMGMAFNRCNKQCSDSYYYNTDVFYNFCKSTCSEMWEEK